MDPEREAIIEKIKKLLRMKRGGTPAEVETALALAAELARKHGIDMGAVDPDQEPDQPIGHIDAVTAAKIGWECKYAALVAQNFFNVTALITQQQKNGIWYRRRQSYEWKIRLIGTAWDTQIATCVYHFVAAQMRRCWANRSRRIRAGARQQFLWGMYIGICTNLEEQKRQQVSEAGLVLIGRAVARRDDYIKRNWGDYRSNALEPDGDARLAKVAGYAAGRATEIRSGLTEQGKAAPMIS
jgi:hypothetical protein